MTQARVSRPDPTGIKRLAFWQLTLLPTYVLAAAILFSAALAEAAALGPYTAWYNRYKRSQAVAAQLVGSSESRVIEVLGTPNDVVRRREGVVAPIGVAAVGGEVVTTYNYYPYPGLPFSKFEVHCTGGVVRGIEMFDD